MFFLFEYETTYNTLKQELFALRFLEKTTKDEEELKTIKQKIQEVKIKILKEGMIKNDKHKRK